MGRSRNRNKSSEKEMPLPPTPAHTAWAPVRGLSGYRKTWQGAMEHKPWDRRTIAVLPHLDTPELLEANVGTLLGQTEKPYVVVVDTGSLPRNSGILDELERSYEDVEVHRLRFGAVVHPSDPVAIAMDLAFSLCPTDFLYATHVDCFIRRQDYLEELVDRTQENGFVACGYKITDRPGIDTSRWLGHTSTVFDMKLCDELGLGWSQRRLCRITAMDHEGDDRCNGYPDTEFLINTLLDRVDEEQGIETRDITGEERNFETTLDDDIYHVRSYASSRLYSADYHASVQDDMGKALKEARENAARWSG